MGVRVVVEEADCGCAACVDVMLEVGSVAVQGVGVWMIDRRAESGGRRSLGTARGLVYKRYIFW